MAVEKEIKNETCMEGASNMCSGQRTQWRLAVIESQFGPLSHHSHTLSGLVHFIVSERNSFHSQGASNEIRFQNKSIQLNAFRRN